MAGVRAAYKARICCLTQAGCSSADMGGTDVREAEAGRVEGEVSGEMDVSDVLR